MNPATLTDRLKQLVELHFSSDSRSLEVVTLFTEHDIMWDIRTALYATRVPTAEYVWSNTLEAAQHFLALEKLFAQQKRVVLFMTQEQLLQDGTNFLNWKHRFDLRAFNQDDAAHAATPGIVLVATISQKETFPQELARSISSVVLNWNVEF